MAKNHAALAPSTPAVQGLRELDANAKHQIGLERWQRVHIEGLVIECLIGIHDHEKTNPQRICIDVELTRREPKAPTKDIYDRVMCYETVIEKIRALASAKHIKLVETLAEQIADSCQSDYPNLHSLKVGVSKLDIFSDVSKVGVQLERHYESEAD
jgi:7,8-dihydroneopterin aldolase/epimerase/oxygenase